MLRILLLASPVWAAAPPPVDLGTVTEKHEMVPMRDGTRLSVYLFIPEGKGPWPALYEQRYADITAPATRKNYAKLAEKGYVVAAQNFRGAQKSEGTWVGYRALGWGEKQDGFDTVAWLAKQTWCTGKVGTFGGSQAGFAQNFLAITRPPALKAQYMTDTGLSLYHEGYRIGGTTRPERFKQMDSVCRVPEHNRLLLKEWFAHPTYDEYWTAEDCSKHFDKMDVPCFTLGSWFDFMNVGSIDSYIGRQHKGGPNSRGTQKLLIGPWLHGGAKSNKIGDMVFKENANFDLRASMIRWFDHHLKGIDTGVMKEPTVSYYAMGADEWRTTADWPVKAKDTAFHLHVGGKLSKDEPSEVMSSSTFIADPLKPATIPGRAFPGAKDACDFEKQPNVLTFTTEELADPTEWTGKVKANLYVSSDSKDADVIVRVTDVHPDGRSILLIDYVRRLRYRESYEKEVFMKPGDVYPVSFDVGWISQVFAKGHRIRVTVASTGAPFYEPNPNTGEPLTLEFPMNAAVAKLAVHHEKTRASHIVAPVK